MPRLDSTRHNGESRWHGSRWQQHTTDQLCHPVQKASDLAPELYPHLHALYQRPVNIDINIQQPTQLCTAVVHTQMQRKFARPRKYQIIVFQCWAHPTAVWHWMQMYTWLQNVTMQLSLPLLPVCMVNSAADTVKHQHIKLTYLSFSFHKSVN